MGEAAHVNPIARGAVSGLGATVTMSAVIAGGKLMGLVPATPPKHITANLGHKLGLAPRRASDSAFHASWISAHLGYGMAMGIGYHALRNMLPRRGWYTGVAYGLLVWAVSYVGLLPAMGLFPPPEKTARRQTAVMIVAHMVYGASLEIGA